MPLRRVFHPSTLTPSLCVTPGFAFLCPTGAYSDAGNLDFSDDEYFPDDVDCSASDCVYTVDATHGRPLAVPEGSCTPAGSWEVSPGRRNSMTASNTAVSSNIVAAFGKKGDGLPYYSVAATRLLGGAIGSDDDL
uniref:Uncharacterized protein n=1 Tax=Oryza barthii TaxID=65489 RepID=A0A0D3GH84_9ORYZ